MKKSIIQITLEYLHKKDPDTIGFTKAQIFEALVPATKGLDYNPHITRSELGAAIACALKNKRNQFLDYHETNFNRFYFYTPYEKQQPIPDGYSPYIARSTGGRSVTTHLYKKVGEMAKFMCKNKIKSFRFDTAGNKGICPHCLHAVEVADLKSKYELLRAGYERLVKENNELQVENNKLMSERLNEVV